MTQTVLDRIVDREPVRSAIERPATRPIRPRRAGRGSGRGAAPVLRPAEVCPAPGLARRPVARSHACALPRPDIVVADLPVVDTVPGWRLTDRGVAVVLVTGLMIMVAALAVVGLTALKVTGDGYQPTASASLPR